MPTTSGIATYADALVLMLLRVSAYWGSEYPCLKKCLILIYTLCTMATAALQMVAVSKVYRTLHSTHALSQTESPL
jgi:hypothetical protein